jgi:hypothetical protein
VADNPLKACADAIAEADNEIGGLLITRLRESHRHGRDDGELQTADPDRLTSPVDVFVAGDVGKLVDILEADTPSGNEGTYEIATYVDAKNVDLQTPSGGNPGFTDEDPVQWRFATLRVETTYEFPEADILQRVYVGTEPDPIPYAAIDQTVGAQELLGLGEHRFDRIGATLRTASPQTVTSTQEFFSSSDVGKALWILPKAASTGNEGLRVIATFVNSRQVTFTGAAISADEDDALYLVKTYTGVGYLTELQRFLSEVIDGSESYSGLDKLRRSLLIDLAVEEEIDRIARRFGLIRPKSLVSDEIWRRVVMVRAYLAASPVYSLELMLEALYPQGGWSVDEDLTLEALDGRPRHANEVFITIPEADVGADEEGRWFLMGLEDATSTTTTAVAVAETPTTVISVKLEPYEDVTDMDVLPSADTPAWTYQAEAVGTEGTFFSVTSVGGQWDPVGGYSTGNCLVQVADNPGVNSGRYYRTITHLDGPGRYKRWIIEAYFKKMVITTVNGYPWHLRVRDGEIAATLEWDDDDVRLDATIIGTGVLTSRTDWVHLSVERDGPYVTARLDGEILAVIAASDFAADANTDISFGHLSTASTQDWTVRWDNVRFRTADRQNYWNLTREDGSLSTSSDILTSAAALFVSGDTGKLVWLEADNNENWGLWEATYGSSTTLTLAGISHAGTARVYTSGSTQYLELLDPLLHSKHIGKDIIISGSALGNNRTVTLATMEHERLGAVTNPGADFIDEDELDWEFDTEFVNESNIPWELVDAASKSGVNLTLREALPAATTGVRVHYTTVLSAQLLRNEFTRNLGTGSDLYYPAYLFDIDAGIKAMIDLVTAAGVIPRFSSPD